MGQFDVRTIVPGFENAKLIRGGSNILNWVCFKIEMGVIKF